MIAVANKYGDLLSVFPAKKTLLIGYHQQFGFIEKDSLASRKRLRRAQGLRTKEGFLCEVSINNADGAWRLEAKNNCRAEAIENGKWTLQTEAGEFQFGSTADFSPWSLPERPADKPLPWKAPTAISVLILALLLAWPRAEEEEEEIQEPVTVRVTPRSNTVAIRAPKASKVKTLTEEEKQNIRKQRAIAQNLGFLKMVGKRNLKNALGSAPTQLKDVSAGAGEGKEGSGGELLVGIGKGLKRTTVGNTGVAGLGGIGNKGAGGGAGGYGETMVASGSGRLSGLPVSDDILLDGGLDRNVVQATIAKYLAQVRACYENGLTKRPGIQGQVTTQFEINGSGMLNFAKVVRSSLGDKLVESCIVKRMLTWQFPKPRGGVKVAVKYPFLLRPVNVGD